MIVGLLLSLFCSNLWGSKWPVDFWRTGLKWVSDRPPVNGQSCVVLLRGLGRKNEGQVNDLNFPGSADRFAGLLHPLNSLKCSKTMILRVQQAVACFTRSVKKVR